MAEYNMTDKEQVDMLKKWWNDYGKAIAIALFIGLIVAFGWRYWRAHKIERTQRASSLYEQLIILESKHDMKGVGDITNELMRQYKNTPYATMAVLQMAREYANEKKYNKALQQCEWVFKNEQIASFRQVARIRAARILLFQNKQQQALETLAKVEDKTYLPLIDEVKGDIFMAMKEPDKARKFYKKAKSGLAAEGVKNPILNMKLAQP